ncbi:MAG: ethanolamine ammonia-lyase subunit EutC [Cyanobacteria bacterium REEB67]|nr:ethanolamine ammonia-lyase subunit EutC [Cyanobacteria bacterium REEB67]
MNEDRELDREENRKPGRKQEPGSESQAHQPNVNGSQALKHLQSTTPARIGVGRKGGTRPPTKAMLAFLADHAEARDAVQSNLSAEFVERFCRQYDCTLVDSSAGSRQDFVLFPPRGKRLSDAALSGLKAKLKAADVQIVISDGLSALAVEENLPDLYPMLLDGFEGLHISLSSPVMVQWGRVAVADQIAHAAPAKVAINLIGERPGLSCAKGLSAYITFNPNPATTISSDRTVISNIHDGGTPAIEAGAFIVKVVQRILKEGVSGVRLQALG